ncbi:MAG: M42 family metallopeptidase [Meiothermus sp.]|nr:M42 family metallopeptidase [Meiothermus sp.]
MNLAFLQRLLEATGPTGFEAEAVRVWAEEARSFADRVFTDHLGNGYATINPGASPRVMFSGHVDEIGVIVSYIDEGGMAYVQGLGNWDAQVLVGQRVRFVGPQGAVSGVVGRKPIHLLEGDERDKTPKLKDLYIDLGARDKAEAEQWLEVGSVGVIDQPPRYLLGRRMVSKGIDNRIGAFVVLEGLRLAKEWGVQAEVTAVASVQEEIGAYGARTAAFQLRPDSALIVDVTPCSKQVGVDPKQTGEGALGAGAVLDVGPFVHPKVLRQLRDLAARAQLSYKLATHGRSSGTDTDEVAMVRGGIPCGLVSVPNRYMHSPSEMIDLGDVEQIVKLFALYAQNPATEFTR